MSASRSSFGAPYDLAAFGHGDRIFLEFVLQRHAGFKALVEFGTWAGVTSVALGVAAALRGGALTSFDVADHRDARVTAGAWLPSMSFVLADLEDAAHLAPAAVAALRSADFLFNDGGDKHRATRLYARFLPVGAGLFQHDFTYDHSKPQRGYTPLEELGFEPLYEDVARHVNSCGRFWLRTSAPQPQDDRAPSQDGPAGALSWQH